MRNFVIIIQFSEGEQNMTENSSGLSGSRINVSKKEGSGFLERKFKFPRETQQ